ATAVFEGLVAGVVLLVLNAIGHYGFEAPAIPFVYGLALILAIIVAVLRSIRRRDDDFPGVET
ncbi:MAG: hypothetical protein OEV14_07535, partial [Gammaproteobacteria bacterium]|nr:hypothetical protein [Gammaproteobacteria bacterium]